MNSSCLLRRWMILPSLLCVFLMPFWALAQTKSAPYAPQSIANQTQAREAVLPLRNLQIEVRQLGGVASQSSQLAQQALVLNGRNVSFSLGQSVPLRVVQVLAYKGDLHFVPSTILIDRNSGFSVRPLWYGDDVAEVEISTALAQGTRQAKTFTTLQVQINEWITIAQSEDARSNTASGIVSQNDMQAQSNLRVEMRVTVR